MIKPIRIISLIVLFILGINVNFINAQVVDNTENNLKLNSVFEIYQAAKKNLPQIQIGQLSVMEQKANADSARAYTYPQVTLTGSMTRYKYDVNLENGGGNNDNYNENKIGVRINQPLLKFGLFDTVAGYEALNKAATADLAKTIEESIIEINNLILDILANNDYLEQVMAQHQAIANLVKIQKRRFELGEVSKIEFNQVNAELKLLDGELLNAKNRQEIAQLRFYETTKINPPTFLWKVAEIPSEAFSEINEKQLLEKALANNNEIQSAFNNLEALIKFNQASQSDFFPSINFSAGVSQNFANGIYSQSKIAQQNQGYKNKIVDVGIYLDYPIYSGGGTSAQALASFAKQGKMRASIDLELINLRVGVKTAFSQLNYALSLQSTAQASLIAAQSSRDAVVRGGELGLKNTFEVLTAEEKLLAAKAKNTNAKILLIQNFLNLQKITGELNEDDINQIDKWIEVK